VVWWLVVGECSCGGRSETGGDGGGCVGGENNGRWRRRWRRRPPRGAVFRCDVFALIGNQKKCPLLPNAHPSQPYPFGVRWQSEARAPTPLSQPPSLSPASPAASKAVSPVAHCVARPLPPHSKATRRPNVVPSLPQPCLLRTASPAPALISLFQTSRRGRQRSQWPRPSATPKTPRNVPATTIPPRTALPTGRRL
jgi:hypothetical protein